MVKLNILQAFTLCTHAMAWNAPMYPGYTLVWDDTFNDTSLSLPDATKWNTIVNEQNWNYELERYTNSSDNIRFGDAGTLQLIPTRDDAAPQGWSSGRIESKYTLTPDAGKTTRVEASLRLAGHPGTARKKGIWPAFWLHGDAYRHGTPTPECGEIDVMENVNGQRTVHSVVHCDVASGGLCNEDTGLGSTTDLSDDEFHVWRVQFDRRDANFKSQSITWYKDGGQYARVAGSQIGSSKVWATICQSPLYIIFNVAVGGTWVCSRDRQ